MFAEPPPTHWRCQDWRVRAVLTTLLLLLLLIVFRDLLAACVRRWMTEPQYSHGFMIPVMAVALGWMRRERMLAGDARSHVSGLVLTAVGAACHILGTWLYVEVIDAIGFLAALNGVALLVWGKRFYRGVWPAFWFIGFMLPLPFQLERMLSEPLQEFGASAAAWFIQAFGIPAIAQGNIILMGEIRLGVAEACSGLRMLMVFFAISSAAILISHRTRWEKVLILLSAIPIALICNIARIVGTAAAFQYAGQQTAELIFHDLSGWLMMPLAISLLYLEMKIIDVLFVEVADARPGVTWHHIPPACTVKSET